MSAELTGRDRLPDIARADTMAVTISTRHAGGRDRQTDLVETMLAAWESGPWPPEQLSLSFYVSTDGENVLTYAQWSDPEVRISGAVTYRLYRSLVPDAPGGTPPVPGCIAIPSFDVDGPERQRAIVDTLLDGPLARPIPGLVAAHFHVSADGTRVINYAEWADEDTHQGALSGDVLSEAGRTTRAMPGVRGIGCPRYRLHRGLTRPSV
ncbi:monooxygenase [Streptomyces sp. NPDC088348]|uniref:monooxygenase n=1 Tax=Streptomyces sp. NPDC088348 TaxID=3365853 RepID=UPI003802F983